VHGLLQVDLAELYSYYVAMLATSSVVNHRRQSVGDGGTGTCYLREPPCHMTPMLGRLPADETGIGATCSY